MKKNISRPRDEKTAQGVRCKAQGKKEPWAVTYRLNDTPPLFFRMAPIGISD
jgi:hypothetical protein